MNDNNLGLVKYWIKCIKRQPGKKNWWGFTVNVPPIIKTIEVTEEQYSKIVSLNIHYHNGWGLNAFTTHPNIDILIDELLKD